METPQFIGNQGYMRETTQSPFIVILLENDIHILQLYDSDNNHRK